MNFEEELVEKTAEVEAIVLSYLPKTEGFQNTIFSAMEYAVTAGGKRLRPLLMLETYELFGGEGRVIEPFMAAIEFIHTYSLIHDDLPAMDDDDYRRGRLTTHKVYGEAMGILAGDALLNYAFETAANAFAISPVDTNIGRAFQILAAKAGVYGMIGGQVVDVESEKKHSEINQEKLDFIYDLKTGALIEAAMKIGAILANASEEEQNITEKIASKVGRAFQIQDDILDITGTQDELGKPIGSDEKNEKVTYVSLNGVEEARKQVELLSKEAVELLEELPRTNSFLKELILSLIYRRK